VHPDPGGLFPVGKRTGGEAFRLATDRPGFRFVRRIEPDIPILTLTPSPAAAAI